MECKAAFSGFPVRFDFAQSLSSIRNQQYNTLEMADKRMIDPEEVSVRMTTYFFPSCKASAQFKQASKNARVYVKEKLGVGPIGCCRPNHAKLAADDTAVVVCNNCALIIDENTDADIEFLWEVIDSDPDFPFPDYRGERITLQDCWIAFDKPAAHEAVRSLLRKMNIKVVELAENRENSKFCGPNLCAPCTESNAELARKRYVEEFPHMFTPMGPDEQAAHFREHCEQIETDKAVCYCKFCADGINMGGKTGVHLLELLFPSR